VKRAWCTVRTSLSDRCASKVAEPDPSALAYNIYHHGRPSSMDVIDLPLELTPNAKADARLSYR
jgi:hypothetical protein